MPDVVSFAAPYDGSLVACEAQPLVPAGSDALAVRKIGPG